jgi:hypothetical protein
MGEYLVALARPGTGFDPSRSANRKRVTTQKDYLALSFVMRRGVEQSGSSPGS